MVKKSSFLEKLKNRLRHSDVRVEDPVAERGGPGSAPRGGVDAALRGGLGAAQPTGSKPAGSTPTDSKPAEPKSADAKPAEPEARTARPVVTPERARIAPVPAVREPELLSGRKMSQREEATVAIQDGFKELTSLLRGMQNRVEDQGERFAQAADGLTRMPAIQEAQLELLRQLADQMEGQNRTQHLVAQSLGDLPQLMGHVREALDRAAATDERTASTLTDFRSNMDRIQSSMEQMVDHSRQHAEVSESLVKNRDEEVRELTETLVGEQKHATREVATRLEATQRDSVRSLRDAQADQALRLGKMLEDGTKTSRAVLVLLGLTFLALVTIAVLLATR